jgi:hypothetical protein
MRHPPLASHLIWRMRTVGRSRVTDNPAIRQTMYDTVANWPRIGPAAYRTMTQEDGMRGEANSQVDGHLIASPQVAESSREPSQGGDTGSNPVGTTRGNG